MPPSPSSAAGWTRISPRASVPASRFHRSVNRNPRRCRAAVQRAAVHAGPADRAACQATVFPAAGAVHHARRRANPVPKANRKAAKRAVRRAVRKAAAFQATNRQAAVRRPANPKAFLSPRLYRYRNPKAAANHPVAPKAADQAAAVLVQVEEVRAMSVLAVAIVRAVVVQEVEVLVAIVQKVEVQAIAHPTQAAHLLLAPVPAVVPAPVRSVVLKAKSVPVPRPATAQASVGRQRQRVTETASLQPSSMTLPPTAADRMAPPRAARRVAPSLSPNG